MQRQHLKRPILYLLVLMICGLNYRPILAAWWVNLAQINTLHNTARPDLWNRATELMPTHLRWQFQWLNQRVNATDKPSISDEIITRFPFTTRNAFTDALMFPDLLAQQRYEAILNEYQARRSAIHSPTVCAVVALTQIKTANALFADHANDLLACALNINPNSPQFGLLSKANLSDPAFWLGDLGQRITKTLHWQAQSLKNTYFADKTEKTSALIQNHIANLLQQSADLIVFGPNLVKNGDFESSSCMSPNITPDCAIDKWRPSWMNSGLTWNAAAFVLGTEITSSHGNSSANNAMRIDGLSLERLPSREPARAGFHYAAPISLSQGVPYVMSFNYYITGLTMLGPAAGLWMSGEPNVFYQHDLFLPATPNGWKRVILIGWNQTGKPAEIQPLLRLWTEGTVWFDDFAIRQITSDTLLPQRDTILDIRDVSGN
ncbi:MAG: hypothetical protein WCL57_00775 [Chloroflexota bacterium]|jgi:hypothetical protein|nr:hypothetical protein [Chloroflexota bacterium]